MPSNTERSSILNPDVLIDLGVFPQQMILPLKRIVEKVNYSTVDHLRCAPAMMQVRSRGQAIKQFGTLRLMTEEEDSTPDIEALREKTSPQQRALVQGVLMGKTQGQAALDAGYSKESQSILDARVNAWRVLRNKNVREYYRAIMEAAGNSDEYLAEKAHDLMNVHLSGITKTGDVVDLGPDGSTQVKALDLVFRVMGAYPDPRLEIDQRIMQVVTFRAEETLGPDPFSDNIIDAAPPSE